MSLPNAYPGFCFILPQMRVAWSYRNVWQKKQLSMTSVRQSNCKVDTKSIWLFLSEEQYPQKSEVHTLLWSEIISHVQTLLLALKYQNMLAASNNKTQKAAIASPPSATHPQLWAELYIHVHVSIQECTLSHLHLHPHTSTCTCINTHYTQQQIHNKHNTTYLPGTYHSRTYHPFAPQPQWHLPDPPGED